MDHVFTPWLVITLVIIFMGVLVVWSRRETMLRGVAVIVILVAMPGSLAALWVPLGWAVPLHGGLTALGGDYPVLGAKMVVGKAIYVLIDTGAEPRYYRIPWDRKLADQLQDILDNPGNAGAKISIPYEFSWNQSAPQFHPLPQPKFLPDKPRQERAPHFDA